MKRIFCLIAFVLGLTTFSFAQEKKGTVTESIQVSGVCGQCKDRIEKAAYLPGVRRAVWDKDTKELTVSYRASKVRLEDIEKKIAEAGHDAGEIKADEDAYEHLPSCCAYKQVADH